MKPKFARCKVSPPIFYSENYKDILYCHESSTFAERATWKASKHLNCDVQVDVGRASPWLVQTNACSFSAKLLTDHIRSPHKSDAVRSHSVKLRCIDEQSSSTLYRRRY